MSSENEEIIEPLTLTDKIEIPESIDISSDAGPSLALCNIQELQAAVVEKNKKENDERYCWVCFATDDDDILAQWVIPCKCRGTTKWVHQSCLQRWVSFF
jgi:E3 ubiquitin-protein ligase MARCH5